MSDKPKGEGDFDPSEFVGEIKDRVESNKHMELLAQILQDNGFTVITQNADRIVLHRTADEKVVLEASVRGADLQCSSPNTAFIDEVVSILKRREPELEIIKPQ